MDDSKIKSFITSWKEPITVLGTLAGILGALFGTWQLYYNQKHSHDLNGAWRLTFYIESSTLKRYIGKSSGNKIIMHNEDEKFTAKGERWWVDDTVIPYAEHDQIDFEGTLKGEKLHATYTLHGALRNSVGEIQMKLIDDNHMVGNFMGTAADTKGRADAVRL